MKMNEQIKIYELYMNKGILLSQGYEQRLSSFTGLITAIIGGIIYCFISIGRCPTFFYVFLLGLIFIIPLSELAIWSTKRLYRQLLENTTIQAKIEFDLEMTEERKKTDSKADGTWWKSESYILQRHIKSRKKYNSSKKFIDGESNKGYQRIITFTFRSIYIKFILFGLIILHLSIFH